MSGPVISVVIGVRDGEQAVESTLDSVLDQSCQRLEVVAVDDGSKDATATRLSAIAERDARLRVLRQPAHGLTAALIAGCEVARGAYIARVDAGDRMLPGRLEAQQALLDEHADAALVASGYRLAGPEGELLVEHAGGPELEDLSAAFADAGRPNARGIAHVTVMFRRASYLICGGYRRQFGLSQDVDLWLRLAKQGRFLREGEVRTEIRITLDGLSPRHHAVQLELRKLALEAARARAKGEDELPHLTRAAQLSEAAIGSADGTPAWQAAYFVGACLERRRQFAQAARYYRLALDRAPLAPRPRLRLMRLAVFGMTQP